MAFIKIIEPEDAKGPLAKEYDAAVRRAGRVYNVVKLQSHRPGVLRRSTDLYRMVMHGESELTRAERELLATTVSAVNQCHY